MSDPHDTDPPPPPRVGPGPAFRAVLSAFKAASPPRVQVVLDDLGLALEDCTDEEIGRMRDAISDAAREFQAKVVISKALRDVVGGEPLATAADISLARPPRGR